MIAAYTIVTRDYLPHAKSLADSLLKYNPDFTFFICLIGEKTNADESFFVPSIIIDTTSTTISDFESMRSRYNNFQLSCALKPFFAEIIFNEYKPEAVIYLDGDILVFNDFSLLKKHLKSHTIIITPHSTNDEIRNDENKLDLMLLNSGVFNAGFFAMSNSKESFKFIKWWKHKMLTECYRDVANGRFDDQIWFNFIPIYFNQTLVLKDPGYNMAIWNMRERFISKKEKNFIVNEESPLVFFHYSGYNVDIPDVPCRYMNIYTFEQRPDVRPVFKSYRDCIRKNKTILSPQVPDQKYFGECISFLKNFISENEIKSITEIGQQDFSLSKTLTKEFPDIIYNWCDDCKQLVEHFSKENKASQVNFFHVDPTLQRVPSADLVIINNFFQNLSNAEIKEVLENVKECRHVLVTEHLLKDGSETSFNKEKRVGWLRITERSGVYLDKPPFNVPCKELFSHPADVWVENDTKDDWLEQTAFKKTFLAEVTAQYSETNENK